MSENKPKMCDIIRSAETNSIVWLGTTKIGHAVHNQAEKADYRSLCGKDIDSGKAGQRDTQCKTCTARVLQLEHQHLLEDDEHPGIAGREDLIDPAVEAEIAEESAELAEEMDVSPEDVEILTSARLDEEEITQEVITEEVVSRFFEELMSEADEETAELDSQEAAPETHRYLTGREYLEDKLLKAEMAHGKALASITLHREMMDKLTEEHGGSHNMTKALRRETPGLLTRNQLSNAKYKVKERAAEVAKWEKALEEYEAADH